MAQAQIDLVKVAEFDNRELRRLYLQYVNDFLTYTGVARYYGWSLEFATSRLNAGRVAHEAYCAAIKSKESK